MDTSGPLPQPLLQIALKLQECIANVRLEDQISKRQERPMFDEWLAQATSNIDGSGISNLPPSRPPKRGGCVTNRDLLGFDRILRELQSLNFNSKEHHSEGSPPKRARMEASYLQSQEPSPIPAGCLSSEHEELPAVLTSANKFGPRHSDQRPCEAPSKAPEHGSELFAVPERPKANVATSNAEKKGFSKPFCPGNIPSPCRSPQKMPSAASGSEARLSTGLQAPAKPAPREEPANLPPARAETVAPDDPMNGTTGLRPSLQKAATLPALGSTELRTPIGTGPLNSSSSLGSGSQNNYSTLPRSTILSNGRVEKLALAGATAAWAQPSRCYDDDDDDEDTSPPNTPKISAVWRSSSLFKLPTVQAQSEQQQLQQQQQQQHQHQQQQPYCHGLQRPTSPKRPPGSRSSDQDGLSTAAPTVESCRQSARSIFSQGNVTSSGPTGPCPQGPVPQGNVQRSLEGYGGLDVSGTRSSTASGVREIVKRFEEHQFSTQPAANIATAQPIPEDVQTTQRPHQAAIQHSPSLAKVRTSIEFFETRGTPGQKGLVGAANKFGYRADSSGLRSGSRHESAEGALSASATKATPGKMEVDEVGSASKGPSLAYSASVPAVSAPARPVRKELFRSNSERVATSSSAHPANGSASARTGLSEREAPSQTTSAPLRVKGPPAGGFGRSITPTPNSSRTAGHYDHQGSHSARGHQDKENKIMQNSEAFERLASGHRRDDVAKPKSLKAAEQAKLQDERRQRERQEREQEIRARQQQHHLQQMQQQQQQQQHHSQQHKQQHKQQQQQQQQQPLQPQQSRQLQQQQQQQHQQQQHQHHQQAQKSHLNSSSTASGSGRSRPAAAAIVQGSKGPSTGPPTRTLGVSGKVAHLPPVDELKIGNTPAPPLADMSMEMDETPCFASPSSPEPWRKIREIPLPPKCLEDNYELSDAGENSDEEQQVDRSHKKVPKWCDNYLKLLARQEFVDPDTIFTGRVPSINMDEIFTQDLYDQVGKARPKRQRGSSGDWGKDRLTAKEIRAYKNRMGQGRSCLELLEDRN